MIDDILDPVMIEPQPSFAPAAEIAADLARCFPALRRNEIWIGVVPAVVGDVLIRQKIGKADLADLPFQLQVGVPARRRAPVEQDASFRTEKVTGLVRDIALAEFGIFGAAEDLEIQVAGQGATERDEALVARFGDDPATLRVGNRDVATVGLKIGERADLLESIVRPLEGGRPVVRPALPVILQSPDRFAGSRILPVQQAVARRAAVIIGALIDQRRRMFEMAQPDQFQAATAERRRDVAVDVIAEA